jgi:hypothetical protein
MRWTVGHDRAETVPGREAVELRVVASSGGPCSELESRLLPPTAQGRSERRETLTPIDQSTPENNSARRRTERSGPF